MRRLLWSSTILAWYKSADKEQHTANKCCKKLAKFSTHHQYKDSPNDITPTAWKKPELIMRRLLISPRESDGTRKPCVMTVTTITIILTRASADAFANYWLISF